MKRTLVATALLLLAVPALTGQAQTETLFPTPLHLVREISDPISGRTAMVEEYYAGNRVISIAKDKVTIADYGTGRLTEIDHAAGTWSEGSFEEIADARRTLAGTSGADPEMASLTPELVSPQNVAGQVAETFAFSYPDGELRRIEVSLSPQIELSKAAIDVIAGAAFPNEPGRASRATTALARRKDTGPDKGVRTSAVAPDRYRLPLRKVLEFEVDGERLRIEDRVVGISNDLPPADLLAVPSNAAKVEPHLIRMRRLSEELDRLPGVKENQKP